jgi:choline dehydrogenase-like flavoprotein
MAGIIMDESRFDPARGFAGGYELETLPGFGLAGVAANMKPGGWGREYAEDIAQYRNTACMWIVGEDMPQEANGVTLHPTEKDQYGLPVPIVHFKDHPNDIAMRNHAFGTGGDVYRAAGATKVYERMPFSSTHNMGTCRMSENPRDGVCNRFGQAHEVPNLFISDGSQFTTGAAENPTLTIVALAIRQAEYLADQMSKGEI